MGYELDKLMRQFGINSPSAPVYTGTTPEQQSAYNAQVAQQHQQIASTPMYAQQQFQTGSPLNQPVGRLSLPFTPHNIIQPPPQMIPPPPRPDVGNPVYGDAASTPTGGVSGMNGVPGGPIGGYNEFNGGIDLSRFDNFMQPMQAFDGSGASGSNKDDDMGDIEHFADGGLADLSDKYAGAAPAPKLDFVALMDKYQPNQSAYGEELRVAREAASKEQQAFQDLLQRSMAEQSDGAPSKAEMYFRLAAAFGAPTKTGSFGEALGRVGETLGAHAKETRETNRESAARKLQLAVQAQQMRMAGAKEDVNALRDLAGKEMGDKRAITSKLIEEYVNSGKPQSAAGKQALDEGLQPGTSPFQVRVAEIAKMNVDRQAAQIAALIGGTAAQQGNLKLAEEKLEMTKASAKKLTPTEMKLKTDAEDTLASTTQAMDDLKRAYKLNPNTFDNSVLDLAQHKLLGAAGSKDPKVIATNEMNNLLQKGALSQLKATFPGAISNDERKALLDVQGVGAKSIEERSKVMQNGFRALRAVEKRLKDRLESITRGEYRETAKEGGIEDGQ